MIRRSLEMSSYRFVSCSRVRFSFPPNTVCVSRLQGMIVLTSPQLIISSSMALSGRVSLAFVLIPRSLFVCSSSPTPTSLPNRCTVFTKQCERFYELVSFIILQPTAFMYIYIWYKILTNRLMRY